MSENFSTVADKYSEWSLAQKSAGDRLLDLLGISGEEDVLDLGCGTGKLTRKIRSLTLGEVVGADPSDGMIGNARVESGGHEITFENQSAESMFYSERFDVIFMNSAFHWIKDPDTVLYNCRRALKSGGRMGIQAPATSVYSPNFLDAIAVVRKAPETSSIFAGFVSPWYFLETAIDYKELFEAHGFNVATSTIEMVSGPYTPDDVFKIFYTGAAAGYLNQGYYSGRFDDEYKQNFIKIIKENFADQADQIGNVNLMFNRLYLVACK